MKNNKLVVIGLNEINFDYIKAYTKSGKLPNLKKLLEQNKLIETSSESEYKLLEPWIQWVTIQTGQTYDEHKIFRLGDIIERKDLNQIFEKIEGKGKSIGAISPFNADNRLESPSFFVPDPWTETHASGSWLLKGISKSINQLVNDNAQSKVSFSSLIFLVLGLLTYVPLGRIFSHYLKLAKGIKKAGTKATILDSLLGDIFIRLLKSKKPEFSWLFLNSGAHIQHHYLFNSSIYDGPLENPSWYCEKNHDPLLTILSIYDGFLAQVSDLGYKIIVLTGLHQQPHKHMTFYWRLNDHEGFMKKVGIQNYTKLLPRMSRDFLIEFRDTESTLSAERILSSYASQKDNLDIFTIDNRGTSLFVELTYPNDIGSGFAISSNVNGTISDFKPYISFVAIKNGEHNGIGYLTSNFDLKTPDSIQLSDVHDLILNHV